MLKERRIKFFQFFIYFITFVTQPIDFFITLFECGFLVEGINTLPELGDC